MTLDEEVVVLRAENARLQAALAAAQETIARLEARVAELEQKPPPWAKAKTPERPPKPRKRRAPEHNKGRRREAPTQIVEHAYERCLDCQYELRGHSDFTGCGMLTAVPTYRTCTPSRRLNPARWADASSRVQP